VASGFHDEERAVRVLAIDVGGTHVKIKVSGQAAVRKFDSGPALTARQMVRGVLALAKGWQFDVVSIGYPGPVARGRPAVDPRNLGRGWAGFDFAKAFRKPVRILNDAAMQALGSYNGGKMLFLGLGTGLGTAVIDNGVIEPMEVAHLPYKKGRTFEDYAGLRGLERLGKKKWRTAIADIVRSLARALEVDYVVLGGGNAKKLKTLPPKARLGDNANAFLGGFRLWDAPAKAAKKPTRSKQKRRKPPRKPQRAKSSLRRPQAAAAPVDVGSRTKEVEPFTAQPPVDESDGA
jgi:polyphosphate glucokinase